MKKYGSIMMLLMILLVIMPIASKSVDTPEILLVELRDFAEETVSSQPLKTKSMITKEAAEGIRKRSYIGSKVDIYISAYPPLYVLWPIGKKEDQQYDRVVRYQADSIEGLEVDNLAKLHITEMAYIIYHSPGIYQTLEITNYIRADTTIFSGLITDPVRVSDVQVLKKELLHYAVIG